jgi:hypothetical protein
MFGNQRASFNLGTFRFLQPPDMGMNGAVHTMPLGKWGSHAGKLVGRHMVDGYIVLWGERSQGIINRMRLSKTHTHTKQQD